MDRVEQGQAKTPQNTQETQMWAPAATPNIFKHYNERHSRVLDDNFAWLCLARAILVCKKPDVDSVFQRVSGGIFFGLKKRAREQKHKKYRKEPCTIYSISIQCSYFWDCITVCHCITQGILGYTRRCHYAKLLPLVEISFLP